MTLLSEKLLKGKGVYMPAYIIVVLLLSTILSTLAIFPIRLKYKGLLKARLSAYGVSAELVVDGRQEESSEKKFLPGENGKVDENNEGDV